MIDGERFPKPWWTPTPLANWKLFRRRFTQYANACGVPPSEARRAWNELQDNDALFSYLVKRVRYESGLTDAALGASVGGPTVLERAVTGFKFSIVNAELYTLVRCARPSRVVETGVASGVSSTIILQALKQNGSGTLVSLDKPNYLPSGRVNADGVLDETRLPSGKEAGWLVPEILKGRWTLVLGDSKQELTRVLETGPSVDFFFHDSEHSFDIMAFEFGEAWGSLTSGGLLYADDVLWNSAFPAFCESQDQNPAAAITAGHRGLLRKQPTTRAGPSSPVNRGSASLPRSETP